MTVNDQIVPQLNPGFFSYNPIWQRPLVDVYILQALLAKLAVWSTDCGLEELVSTNQLKSAWLRTLEIADATGLPSLLQTDHKSSEAITCVWHVDSFTGLIRAK